MNMARLKKIGIWILAIIVIITAGSYIRRTIAGRRSAVLNAMQSVTAVAEKGDLTVTVSGTGGVEAAVKEEVRTRLSGTISQYHMKDGLQVKAGDILAELETTDMSLQIQSARLNITIQERDLAKLQSEKTYDTVTAPADGKMDWRVKAGEQVQEYGVIGTVQDYSRLEVIGMFNAAQVKQIQPGQNAEVFSPEFLADIPARITAVSAEPTPGTDGYILYEVKAELENPGALSAGMEGWLTVMTADGEKRAVRESNFNLPDAVDIRSPITGKITTLHVHSSHSVHTGEVLAEISDADRADRLLDQIATAELRLQQAQLELQDMERQQAERTDNSTVSAPIDGTLMLPPEARGVGDNIGQGTVLGTVIDYNQMQVVIPVDELDVAKVKTEQEVQITADALAQQILTGKVTGISAQGNSQNGVATFDVTIAIDPVEDLKVGMTVNADILVEQRKNTLLVPIEAVQQQEGRSIVMVAGQSGQNGTPASPEPLEVKTGAYDTSRIEILEGLTEGQEILILGAAGSRDAMQGGNVMFGPGGGTRSSQQGGPR